MLKNFKGELFYMEFKRYFFTDYYVSNTGVVKSIRKNKEIILTHNDKLGYKYVDISEYGKKKKVLVHRMVMLSWCYNIDYINLTVNHKDGNKSNNNISNLEWCTQSENTKHYHNHLKNK